MNKTLGYIYYVFGILLILTVFKRIDDYIGAFLNLSKLFSPDPDGYGNGVIIGDAVGSLLILILIYFLFKWGNKNVRQKKIN